MDDLQNYLRILADTLSQKEQVLGQILILTRTQSELAEHDELDEMAFSNSVNEKEVLIARINQLDDGFTSIYERIRQDVIDQGGLYDTEIRKMQEQIKSCVGIGNEIRVLEERNHAKLTGHFASKKEAYKVKANANSAARSYHQAMTGGQYHASAFMDQKK